MRITVCGDPSGSTSIAGPIILGHASATMARTVLLWVHVVHSVQHRDRFATTDIDVVAAAAAAAVFLYLCERTLAGKKEVHPGIC